jgi:hypothetical protein
MKVLLSCVNSLVSLIGYDTESEKAFWYLPANILRSCGACYDDDSLLVASDSSLVRVSPDGVLAAKLPGPHDNLAHSVRKFGDKIAVADTGNSRVLFLDRRMESCTALEPFEGCAGLGQDAIHLNDMHVFADEVLASCFSIHPFDRHQPYRDFNWKTSKLGAVLALRKEDGATISRIVAAGLDCPHSLNLIDDRLYCCSSRGGEFLEFALTGRGMFSEERIWPVTKRHFLRGALKDQDGSWLLGGSSLRGRDGRVSGAALFRLEPGSGAVRQMHVAKVGEIYEVLPWRDEVMRPLANVLGGLPPDQSDCQDYPAVVDLP